jgi:hypothetical protein
MPQIQIEHDIGDTVYFVLSPKGPRTIAEVVVTGFRVEAPTKDPVEITYKVSYYTEEIRPEHIFKDPWSAFNPDAPRAED